MYIIPNAIAGSKQISNSKRRQAVFNPAYGEAIGEVRLSTVADVEAAIASANQAFPAWSATPPAKRADYMFRFRVLLEENKDDLAKIISREHGKTHGDALGEISRGLEVVTFCCNIPEYLKGTYSRNVSTSIDTHSDRQPLGVVCGITPFNFPVMVPMWMFPVAIAAGNTFVLKPSERDPSASIRLWELFCQAGFPSDVFNVVHGDKEAVDTLIDHPDVKAISFVGSTDIASYIYQRGAKAGKRVQALGGAKNPMIIMPDADLDQASNALMGAAYGSAGERCMAISLAVVVGEDTADALVARLKPKVENLILGAAEQETDPDNRHGGAASTVLDMGPLITAQHRDKILKLITKGIAEGAKLVVDGRNATVKGYPKGFFMGGVLLDHVSPHMTVYQEELFGPVLCVVRVPNLETAIDLANQHRYGNGTAIFTRDGYAARQFSTRVHVGMVGVNIPIPVPVAYHSFGGWKSSLFGDHGIYGQEGVHFYTRLKTITTRWLPPADEKSGSDAYNSAIFTFPSNE